MNKRIPGFLAILLLAVACTAPSTVPRQSEGQLRLRLEGLLPRRTQFIDGTTRARLSVEGPDMSVISQFADVDGETLSVTLTGVPTGTVRLVTLELCGPDDQPIPFHCYRTALPIVSGENTAALSAATTARGEVVAELLKDNWPSLSSLDLNALQEKLDLLKGGTPHYGLINAVAVADALQANGGNLAAITADPQWLLAPARLRVKVTNLPSGMQGAVWLDDPVSPKQTVTGSGELIIEPVRPGTWTLYGRMRDLVATASVTLEAGQKLDQTLSFGTDWQAVNALPYALAAAGSGTFSDKLVLAGGVRWSSTDQFSQSGITRATTTSETLLFDGTSWTNGPTLPTAVCYPVSASDGEHVVLMGGLTPAYPISGVLAVQLLNRNSDHWDTMSDAPFHPLAGGIVGTKLFALGVYGLDETSAQYAELDLSQPGASWTKLTSVFSVLPRVGTAQAMVQGKLYLIGGAPARDHIWNSGWNFLSVNTVEIFDPATQKVRFGAPLPTPRFGAGATVVDGKIWVAGGVDVLGQPISTVEIYDPTTDRWIIHSPLAQAWVHGTVGFFASKVWSLGGMLGAKNCLYVPLPNFDITGLEDDNALLDSVYSVTP